MNILENIGEGLNAIKANKLRTILTASIIAIGITSLVGILTAIDAIKGSVEDSFSNLGSKTYTISNKRVKGSSGGKKSKIFTKIKFEELQKFKNKFEKSGMVSLSSVLSGNAEVKRGSKVSNPNVMIRGTDEYFLAIDGYDLSEGRNFSSNEIQNGSLVAIITSEIKTLLFDENESAIGKKINFLGASCRVIGTLKSKGAASSRGNFDRRVIVPLNAARVIGSERNLRFLATVAIDDFYEADESIGLATGLMRSIRGDRPIDENSFEIKANQSVAERLDEISGYLKLGGFTIGFITLLGASIGLMNIMLVSVTERTREIGLRKALGATPNKIRQQFLIEALVICQMGGIGGIIMGIGIGNLIAKLIGSNSFIIPWVWVLFGVIISMIVGLMSGYIPAHKASKLDPIDSLRFE